MLINEEKSGTIAAMAVVSLLLLSLGMIMCPDTSSAEEESVVEALDPVEILVDGERKEVDAFKQNGIIYALTVETESEEELGVYGIVSGELPLPGVAMVLCNVAIDEGRTCPVTSLLSTFAGNCDGLVALCLADTVVHLEDGCLDGRDFGTIIVSDEVEDLSQLKTQTGYGGDFARSEDVSSTFNVTFREGDISYPGYRDQGDGEQTIVQGITQALVPCEDMFEYPYFGFTEWTVEGHDLSFSDADSLTWVGGELYVNGIASSAAPADMTLIAQWEEDNMYEDYAEWCMWATVGIIVLLAVIGFAMMGYRFMMRRKA
ncbi:MAG: hypothetical protein MJZ38_02930 [archaeon]|nr:hypothetical protein [archaeon]